MSSPTPSEDPGWGGVGLFLATLIPIAGPRALARRAPDGLIALRFTFVSFCGTVMLLGAVAPWLSRGGAGDGVISAVPAAIAVVVWGIAALAAMRYIPRSLDCASRTTLERSYRTRFFVRLTSSESAAVIGFLAVILTRNPLLYLVGAVFTAAAFAWLAPTRAHLAQDQRTLDAKGCSIDLVTTLRALPD